MHLTSGLRPGQVLQRRGVTATALLTGDCSATGPVTARIRRGSKPLPRWSGRVVGKARDGRFTARLAGLPVGGPYDVELSVGAERLAVNEVFVGDVWILAGQSNMEGIGNLTDAPDAHPLARCLYADGVWRQAKDPLHVVAASPDRCHTATTLPFKTALTQLRASGKGTGVGLWFAREMLARNPAVPQGLIACAHGGTSMAQWDPALKAKGGGSLYGSLLRQVGLTGQPVAGMLWYQGCSDASPAAAAVYTERMQGLVAALRRDLAIPRLPWLMVQIGQYAVTGNGRWWEDIRDQQRLLPTCIPSLAVVASIDLPLDDPIHLGGDAFAEIGRRLARQAARLVLRDRHEAPEPEVLSARLVRNYAGSRDTVIELRCRHVVGGWKSDGRAHGFALVGPGGVRQHLCWRVRPHGSNLILHADAPRLDQVAGVIHGPGFAPCCDVRDGRGAALPAFGPLPIAGATAQLDGRIARTGFLPACRVSPVQPPVSDFTAIAFPDPDVPTAQTIAAMPDGFMSLHEGWQGRSGWASIHFDLFCPDALDCVLLLGYDGPFRLAIDGQEVHCDLSATNPAVADSASVRSHLGAGRHRACVLMDLNGGRTWGFWFAIGLPGVAPSQQRQHGPALPTFDQSPTTIDE
jgi:hypothetical protein